MSCSSANVACDAHDDNVLDNFGGVTKIEECRQMCYDIDDCRFITFYGIDSFPFKETCFLLRSCDETHSCSGCVSETESCYQLCGSNVVGVIDNNNLETYFDVETEGECKEYCRATSNCSFYTYFFEEDPNSQMCILLSHLMEPMQPCDTCVTGPLDCQQSEYCSLEFDGDSYKFLMFTETGVDINITVSSSSFCQLRFLAVGGGGHYTGLGAGAGSGYIQYQSKTLSSGTVISLTVGDEEQPSVVRINGETIEAEPGHYPTSNDGADGYSGGGASGSTAGGCNGGSNGGDGEGDCYNHNGGRGTGEDITTYRLDNFVLSPGAGGKYDKSEDGYYSGGGGGGVLVNGEGPQRDSDNQGEGYGGGANCHRNSDGDLMYDGLPGVILLEVGN